MDNAERNTSEQSELEQFVEHRAVALELIMVGVLEAHLGPDTPLRRRIAEIAVGSLLGRLFVTDVTLDPAALPPAVLILDTIRDSTCVAAASAVAPNATRH